MSARVFQCAEHHAHFKDTKNSFHIVSQGMLQSALQGYLHLFPGEAAQLPPALAHCEKIRCTHVCRTFGLHLQRYLAVVVRCDITV